MYLHKDFIMIFSRFLAHEQSYLNDTLRVEIQQKSNQNLAQNLTHVFSQGLYHDFLKISCS